MSGKNLWCEEQKTNVFECALCCCATKAISKYEGVVGDECKTLGEETRVSWGHQDRAPTHEDYVKKHGYTPG